MTADGIEILRQIADDLEEERKQVERQGKDLEDERELSAKLYEALMAALVAKPSLTESGRAFISGIMERYKEKRGMA